MDRRAEGKLVHCSVAILLFNLLHSNHSIYPSHALYQKKTKTVYLQSFAAVNISNDLYEL